MVYRLYFSDVQHAYSVVRDCDFIPEGKHLGRFYVPLRKLQTKHPSNPDGKFYGKCCVHLCVCPFTVCETKAWEGLYSMSCNGIWSLTVRCEPSLTDYCTMNDYDMDVIDYGMHGRCDVGDKDYCDECATKEVELLGYCLCRKRFHLRLKSKLK